MPSTRGIRAGRAFVELFADDSKLVRGLRAAERRLKAFGSRIRNLGLRVAGLGAAMVAPLAASAKAFSSMGDQVAKMAKRTGFGVEALSELRFVASQTGTSLEAMETGFRRMQRSIYDAGRGLSTQTDALADLGLQYKDLAGLAPEKQFKLLAEAISRIEDPTRKAALAQALFGRAGTQLLPMMADGARGIEALQEEARRLGLTMSGEDAKAAEDFTDALDALWKVVKMGVFRVGAALAPTLQDLAERFTDTAVRLGAWIEANRELIVTAAKVAAAVLAGGVALAALGTVISGLGSALGVLATVATTVGGVLKILAAVVGLLVSPIGLVIAAVAALGAYLIKATGAGGRALDWLGGRFKALADFAAETWSAIGNALAAGDIALAAKVLWLSLKVAWLKGTQGLRAMWHDFIFGLQALWEGLGYELGNVWRRVVHGLKSTWNDFSKFMADSGTALGMMWDELLNDINHGLGRISDEEYQARTQQIRLGGAEQFEQAEAEHRRKQRAEDAAHRRSMKNAKQAHDAAMTDIARQNDARVKGAKDALDAANRQRNAALRKARDYGGMESAPGPGKLDDPKALIDRAQQALAGVGSLVANQAAKIGVTGTFNAAAVTGLQSGDATDRMASGIEKIEKNTRPLKNASGPSFQ